MGKRRWPTEEWKKVIFSDESQIVLGIFGEKMTESPNVALY
jgi:hypothetical protein